MIHRGREPLPHTRAMCVCRSTKTCPTQPIPQGEIFHRTQTFPLCISLAMHSSSTKSYTSSIEAESPSRGGALCIDGR